MLKKRAIKTLASIVSDFLIGNAPSRIIEHVQ